MQIKIIYVTEMSVDNKDVIFVFPAYVAPTVQPNTSPLQTVTHSVSVRESTSKFSLLVAITMPYPAIVIDSILVL